MLVASVTTVTILVFLLGLFLLFFMNFQRIRSAIASELEIHAYLKQQTTDDQALTLKHHLASLTHIRSVRYVTRDEALSELRKDTKGEIDLSGIINNPLPAYLSIQVDNPESIPAVASAIQSMKEVEQVNYFQKIIDQFVSLFKTAERLFLGLVILMLLCTLMIIHNTIRLCVFSRKKEIEIMQLVGATSSFVRWPFILEGAFYGLLGATLALIFLAPCYHALVSEMSIIFPILPLAKGHELFPLMLWLLVIGTSVGCSGSYLSVNRYLHC